MKTGLYAIVFKDTEELRNIGMAGRALTVKNFEKVKRALSNRLDGVSYYSQMNPKNAYQTSGCAVNEVGRLNPRLSPLLAVKELIVE